MREEMGPIPEGFKNLDKHEEALKGLKEDLEQGLSESDEEFKKEKEKTAEELGIEIVEENKDKKSKRETIN
jgi:hypothetical protein